MLICNKCKIEKDISFFRKDRTRKNGYHPTCKECYKLWYIKTKQERIACRKIYTAENKEKISDYQKEYKIKYYSTEDNKEKLKEYHRKYSEEHKEEKAEYYRKYKEENKEELLNKKRIYWEENKERLLEQKKSYYQENQQEIKDKVKKYREANPDKIRAYKSAAKKKRLASDPVYKLKESMSHSVRQSLKKRNLDKSKAKWQELLGYTVEQLKEHLEKQFDDKMSWENYGTYWHIDHIKPQSKFVFTSKEDLEFKNCWALDNLQPLEAKENIRKSNKWFEE
jgi:hypothetical protein